MSSGREKRPLISIVVVSWNVKDELVACIESIRANPPSAPWELIVVDNASSDGTAMAVRTCAPWATLIESARNAGLAAGNNAGLEVARGDYVVISNPDVIYASGSLDSLVDCLVRHPKAAFAFARLLNADGTVQTCAGALPRLGAALLGRSRQRAAEGSRAGSFWWDGWAHDEEIEIGHGGEACYAVRTSAVAQIGGQDERFVLDWEGIDWCARAIEHGWQVWFCPSAEVTHLGSRSIKRVPYRWVLRTHRGLYRYFAKRSHTLVRPLLGAVVAARAGAKLAAVSVGRGFFDRDLRD